MILRKHYKVLLRTTQYHSSTTLYHKVLLQYFSVVLQSTTLVLLYYKVLLHTTPVLQNTTPYYKVLRQYTTQQFTPGATPYLFPKRSKIYAWSDPKFTPEATPRPNLAGSNTGLSSCLAGLLPLFFF